MKRRVVFMGTPAFAVPTLNALIGAHEVVAVYSQPPRPAGRGQKETPSPVHALAEAHGIPVHTPARLKGDAAREAFAAHKADVAVVVAYGLLLPQTILQAPRSGCLNLHPSALPRWRGAAPIQHTLLAGDATTDVCIMQMDEGLDTGPILARRTVAVPPDATAGTLHDRFAALGAAMMLEVLQALETLTPVPQSSEGATYATKFSKHDGLLDWREPASALERRIRAVTPWPGAQTHHGTETLKILKAETAECPSQAAPGTVLDDRLTIACGEGALRLLMVQRAGRRPMETSEFLRGHSLAPGTMLAYKSY